MIYLIVLIVWLTINWAIEVLKGWAVGKFWQVFIGTSVRYIAWGWLIGKIALIF